MHETNGAAPAPASTKGGQRPGLMALGGEIEQVMGHLVFYSVPEAWIAHERLTEVWTSEGLDPGLVPPPPGAAGVFQAACRSLEARRTGEAGRVEIRVAQVLATPEECVCQVNWQVRDAAVRLVEHPKALRLTLERRTERIVAERLGLQSVVRDADGHEIALPDPDEMTARVLAFFHRNRDSVPGETLRRLVRNQLRRLAAEAVRESGGVYFVPRRGRTTLEALRRALLSLCQGSGEFHMIPLADDAEQRAMVHRHFVANCAGAIDAELGRLAAVLRARAAGQEPTGAALSGRVSERRRLGALKAEYAGLLRDELSDLDLKLGLLDAQLGRLVGAPAALGGDPAGALAPPARAA